MTRLRSEWELQKMRDPSRSVLVMRTLKVGITVGAIGSLFVKQQSVQSE